MPSAIEIRLPGRLEYFLITSSILSNIVTQNNSVYLIDTKESEHSI